MFSDDLFQSVVHPAELVIRGTAIYLGLVLVFRFLLRRDLGSLGMPDVLFIVLVADASQNAMAGEYRSITDGVVLVGTLVFWNIVLDWLAYRSPTFRKLVELPPLPLIRNGRWVRRNLKSQWITTDEIRAKLRERGIEDIATIRLATLESDGELGILKTEDVAVDPPNAKRPPR
ncbi:MAG: YetF domain-containing protein [Casimicrobiaceae bacterium]